MATLQGQPIKNTYQALLKTANNTNVDSNLQTITDGQGNTTALSVASDAVNIASSYTQGSSFHQKLHYVIYSTGSLNSGETLKLTLDGTGTTGQLLPTGDTVWGVEMNTVSVCDSAGGSLVEGDSFMGKHSFLYTYINSTGSIVGVNTAAITFSPSMSSAVMLMTTGSSQDLEIKFQAPTTATGSSFRVVSTLHITQTTY